jgi:hypothetical protein
MPEYAMPLIYRLAAPGQRQGSHTKIFGEDMDKIKIAHLNFDLNSWKFTVEREMCRELF